MCIINTLSTDTYSTVIHLLHSIGGRGTRVGHYLTIRLIRSCAVQNKVSRTSSYCTIDSTHLISQDV